MDDTERQGAFAFFTEVGIIAQLAATLVEKHLPNRLTNVHFGLLGHLSRRPEGDTPQQLAHAFQVPKTSMTHMIRVLEEGGYIEVGPNPEDARSKLACITGKGLALLGETLKALSHEVGQMRPALDLERMKAVLPELSAIRAQLDAAREN